MGERPGPNLEEIGNKKDVSTSRKKIQAHIGSLAETEKPFEQTLSEQKDKKEIEQVRKEIEDHTNKLRETEKPFLTDTA